MTPQPLPLHQSEESTFPGNGRDLCRICGQPTLVHSIAQQCPEFQGARLTIPSVSLRTLYRRREAERNRR